VEFFKAGELTFKHVVTFNMDEYVNLPVHHKQSYHTFMWENFFSHVDIHPDNTNLLNGNAPDLQEECNKYEEKIKGYGGIELFLGGIGEDGHIAFNEPGSSIKSTTRVKTLAYDTIKANSRFFGGVLADVPTQALTVGVQTIMEAREVVLIITGAKKANALSKCIEEGVSHMWTASALQMHARAAIYCDEDATLEMRVKTVRYFKSVQKAAEDKAHTSGYQGSGQSESGARGPPGTRAPVVTLPAGVPGGLHNSPDGRFFAPKPVSPPASSGSGSARGGDGGGGGV
jgi:glucosamine-6-phosphate deaminase